MATQHKSLAPQADAASDAIRQLREHGYFVIKQAIPADTIHALDGDLADAFAQTPFCQGGFCGERTKRFGRLLARSPLAAELVMHSDILAIANGILGPWCDCLQLNLTQAIALHPGALPQLPQRDQDMWRGAIGETEYPTFLAWVVIGLELVIASKAHAAGTGIPWEQPLQQVLDSVQGPVAKIVAVIIITGLTLAFDETAGGFCRPIQIIFGLSIAFAASSFFSFGGRALIA